MNDPGDDDDYFDMLNDEECGECGGSGYVFDCIDGFCLDAEVGCDMCTTPCMHCNRPKGA